MLPKAISKSLKLPVERLNMAYGFETAAYDTAGPIFAKNSEKIESREPKGKLSKISKISLKIEQVE